MRALILFTFVASLFTLGSYAAVIRLAPGRDLSIPELTGIFAFWYSATYLALRRIAYRRH